MLAILGAAAAAIMNAVAVPFRAIRNGADRRRAERMRRQVHRSDRDAR